MRELGAFNVEIEVLGAVRRAIEQHQSTAFENAVDDRLGQIGVVQHGAPGGQRRLVGREQHRAPAQVSFVDDMEQHVGRVRTVSKTGSQFRGLEISLKRLRRDSVDVMQLHNPSVAECEAGGLVDALQEMRRNGQVRFIGVSTVLPDLPTYLDWSVFDVMQIPYSALERGHEEWITRAGEAGVGIVIRGGVAQGEPGSGRGSADRWAVFERAGLDELREAGEGRSAFVLRYTLSHPHAHTIIVGTTRPEHLRENVAAVRRGPLPRDTLAESKRRLDEAGERAAPAV